MSNPRILKCRGLESFTSCFQKTSRIPHPPPSGWSFLIPQWVELPHPPSGWASSSPSGWSFLTPQWVELPYPQWVELQHPPVSRDSSFPPVGGASSSPSVGRATVHDTAQLCFLSEIFSHPYEVLSRGICLSALLWYSLALTWDSKKLGKSD